LVGFTFLLSAPVVLRTVFTSPERTSYPKGSPRLQSWARGAAAIHIKRNSVYDVCAAQYLDWYLSFFYQAPPIDWPIQPYWQASQQYGIGLVAFPSGQPHLYNMHVPTVS
jgi:hypothetical protein